MKEVFVRHLNIGEVSKVIPVVIDTIVNNKNSLKEFQEADEGAIKLFIAKTFDKLNYHYLGVFDKETKQLVGGGLYYQDENPMWYSTPNTVVAYNEIVTFSIHKGYGVVKALVSYIERYSKEFDVGKKSYIVCGNANTPFAKLLRNTYEHLGFSHYKTFYKEIK